MKMKKARSTAAILAVMALTAGFSVSAADIQSIVVYDNEMGKDTVTITGEQVADSLNGQSIMANAILTNEGNFSKVNVAEDASVGGTLDATNVAAETANVSGKVTTNDFSSQTGYIKEGAIQNLNSAHISALTMDSNATTVGDLTVSNSATINGDVAIENGNSSMYVQDGNIQAQVGNSNISVTNSGVYVNAGSISMVNDKLTAGTVVTDHLQSSTGSGAIFVDSPLLGGEASFERVNADSIDVNNATITGDATVSGKLTTNDFSAQTGYIKEGAIEHLNSDTITSNSLSVTGDATVTGNLAVGGGLEVGGEVISSNDLKAAGTAGKVIGTAPISVTDSQGNAKNTLTEAVNTNNSMIHENAVAIQNNTNAINSLDSRVDDLGGEIDQVGAISAALAGLHPLDYDGTGSKFQLSAAMGSYDSTQAAAIGAFYHFNRDVMLSLGGATAFDGDQKTAANLGVTFRIGEGASGKAVSDDVMARLEAMDQKIAALEQENKDLKNVLGAIDTSLSKEFPDVPANHWAYEAVTKLAGNDVVAGYPDGEFHGDRTMTRYEMAEIIYKAMNRGAKVDQKLVEEFKPEMEQVAANQNT